MTNKLGEAEIRFDVPGIYSISAKREDISRAHAKIIVGSIVPLHTEEL